MSNTLKYNRAYFNEGTEIKEILAADLDKESVYLSAKSKILFDKTGYTLLRPRYCENKAHHFYSPNPSDGRTVLYCEKNELHNNRINFLLKKITSGQKFTIGNSIFKDKKIVGFSPLAVIDNYQWDTEIHRICNNKLTIRHDLFGQAKSLAMSIHRPWVAIEVINTHFPDEAAFSAMIELSKQVPFLVMFDFITEKAESYFINIDVGKGRITPVFYIYEGHVWYGDSINHNIESAEILKRKINECERKIRDLRKKK
ncbi:hypothetical protein [Pectobacterium polaris]|uniref:hypothetical protein n=1 Tax=Pectobacterium polaris TaxID=2042057 RepID=UPI0021C6061B|nr:hypothetical protein [Pectobacterium polaris]MCU1795022.1 hypothetical protein [Pectobacterium polaris]